MYVNTLIKVQHTSNSLVSIFWFFDLPLKTPEINERIFRLARKDAPPKSFSALSGLHVNAP